jgi:short-subunit dehydrogenase
MKKVLITGASDGIGKAIAYALDKDGYSLYLFGRTQSKMDALDIKHIAKKYTFDMKDRDALNNALEDIQKDGGVDILINNAGFNAAKAEVKDILVDDLQAMFDVNTIAPMICIQKFIPTMLEKKDGLIINVLSSCCLFNNPNNGGYTASKNAFESLSKILVKEVKDKGIKVLDVYPGGVDTNFRTIDRPDYLKPETVAKHIIYAIENNEDGMIQEIVVRPIVENNY